ncbi:MAG: hypothetical protein JJU06_16130 [Ectothiorhodospiraceae bacterium]|nr:hypothetical protein [Ectothiorhodospiraceae bacterium]
MLTEKDGPIAVANMMESAMTRQIADNREVARRYNALIRREAGVTMPSTDPQTRLFTTSEGKARVTVTAFMPTTEAGRIERSVMREVMAALHESRQAAALPGPQGKD